MKKKLINLLSTYPKKQISNHIKSNHINKAKKMLRELKKKDPLNMDAYLLLILLCANQGETEEANETYGQMLSVLYEDKPDNLRVAESFAQFKLQKADIDAALEIYKNIVKIDSTYSNAHFWLGFLYEEKGQRNKAIEEWKATLSLDAEHSDSLISLG